MLDLFKKMKTVIATVILFTTLAGLYIVLTPKVFVATSRVAIFRMKIENPEEASDESRNRWIWVRDGLTINSALVSDEQINNFIETNLAAKEKIQNFKDNYSKINYFKNLVTVQYTGGDESNYIIEVKSSDKQLAYDLNSHIFNNLKFLAVQKDHDDFQAVIDKINLEANSYDDKSVAKTFYQNKLMKMKFEHTISQTQKERLFQVVSNPQINETPVWPKPGPIVIAALLMGLIVGSAFEYLKYLLKSSRNDQ
ncbi:MAG: hypothetical protein ACXVCY_13625 [Pseudobdellovibrionaceae bacterium]